MGRCPAGALRCQGFVFKGGVAWLNPITTGHKNCSESWATFTYPLYWPPGGVCAKLREGGSRRVDFHQSVRRTSGNPNHFLLASPSLVVKEDLDQRVGGPRVGRGKKGGGSTGEGEPRWGGG